MGEVFVKSMGENVIKRRLENFVKSMGENFMWKLCKTYG